MFDREYCSTGRATFACGDQSCSACPLSVTVSSTPLLAYVQQEGRIEHDIKERGERDRQNVISHHPTSQMSLGILSPIRNRTGSAGDSGDEMK